MEHGWTGNENPKVEELTLNQKHDFQARMEEIKRDNNRWGTGVWKKKYILLANKSLIWVSIREYNTKYSNLKLYFNLKGRGRNRGKRKKKKQKNLPFTGSLPREHPDWTMLKPEEQNCNWGSQMYSRDSSIWGIACCFYVFALAKCWIKMEQTSLELGTLLLTVGILSSQ